MKFTISAGRRAGLFLCITLLCFIIGSVAVAIVTYGGMSAARIRIAAIIQDIVMFIIPPVATAVLITRRPAEYLMVMKGVRLAPALLIVAAILASIPAMNSIVAWNQGISLPESLSGIEEWMRQSETTAKNFTDALIGTSGMGSLIMALLIVGILAGLSEELFFRGGIQRMLITSGMNMHGAVWITAIIFSAVHVQFYGFVPRMLLGALFGYLTVWSGSLWTAIGAHALNNILATIGYRLSATSSINLDNIGTAEHPEGWIISAISCVVTTGLLVMVYRELNRRES